MTLNMQSLQNSQESIEQPIPDSTMPPPSIVSPPLGKEDPREILPAIPTQNSTIIIGDSTNTTKPSLPTVPGPGIGETPITPAIPNPIPDSVVTDPRPSKSVVPPVNRQANAQPSDITMKSTNQELIQNATTITPPPVVKSPVPAQQSTPQAASSVQFINASTITPEVKQGVVERTDICGDGVCSRNENCLTCPSDCKTRYHGPYPADGVGNGTYAQDCLADNPYLSQCKSGLKVVLLAEVSLQDNNNTLSLTKVMDVLDNLPVVYLIHGEELDASTKPTLKTILYHEKNNIALNLGFMETSELAEQKIQTYNPEFQSLAKTHILPAVNIDNLSNNFTTTLRNNKIFVGLDAPKSAQEAGDTIQYMTKNNGRSFYLKLNAYGSDQLDLLQTTIKMLKSSNLEIVGAEDCLTNDSFEAKEFGAQSVTVGSDISDAAGFNGLYLMLLFVLFTHFH